MNPIGAYARSHGRLNLESLFALDTRARLQAVGDEV
jgi:hypothetical protein